MERVSPPDRKSKHVVICVSGFLQEDEDKSEFWGELIHHFKNAEVFSVRWNACNRHTLFTSGTVEKNSDHKRLFAKTRNILNSLINFTSTIKRQFVFALDQARLTGILLGHFLAKSTFCDDRAITLVGYSLGGVVSFYCMRTLKILSETLPSSEQRLRAKTLMNDVQLWAGAYCIEVTKSYSELKEKSQYCNIVNGNLYNVYSKHDFALNGAFT